MVAACLRRALFQLEKARTWFNRACTLNPDYGDAWAYWYKLELQHGDDMTQAEVRKRCKDVNPKHGELWQRICKRPGTHLASSDGDLKLLEVVKHVTDR
jgi:pre-mRNA-processing factor 6